MATGSVTGTTLEFFRQFIVQTFDASDFLKRHIGHFFEFAKAFGNQKLRERFIDIKFLLEHFRTLDKFLLALLARFCLGHDVDRATGQLTGETDILATTADGKAQLVVGNDNLDAAFFLVDNHAADSCGLQCVDDKGRCIFRPGDDVDLFALHFLNDGLYAAALHPDACTDRVDRAVIADHANLGAATRIAGSSLDFDDAIINFRHFLREQLLHEVGMRTAEQDLRAAIFAHNL